MSTNTVASSRELIEQLRRRAGSGPAGQAAPPAVDLDVRVPSRFVPAQLKRLNEFVCAVADRIAANLAALLRAEMSVRPAPVVQLYAPDLRKVLWESRDYRVPLVLENGGECGWVLLPPACALGWIERLLGGSAQAGEAGKDLGTVEQGLLLDVVAAVAEGLSWQSAAAGGPGLRCTERISRGRGELPGDQTAEYCRLSFPSAPAGAADAPAAADSPAGQDAQAIADAPASQTAEAPPRARPDSLSVVIDSDVVEAILSGAARKPSRSPDQIRSDLLAHLEQVPVLATALLGRAEVAARDVLALQPGDVLVIPAKAAAPIDLMVQGRAVLSGFPVASAGKCALKIVSRGPAAAGAGPARPPETKKPLAERRNDANG